MMECSRGLRVAALILLVALHVGIYADDQQRIVSDIALTTGTDEQTATQILNAIISFMEDLQSKISYIASSSDDLSTKDRIALETVRCCFVSLNSEIQVASVATKRIRSVSAGVYFHRLARLKAVNGYAKVELFFRPDYLAMGRVYRVSDNPETFEIAVSVAQVFKASRFDVYTYADSSTKKFRVRFALGQDTITVAVDEILISDTFPIPAHVP
jgi:hypothetical protein